MSINDDLATPDEWQFTTEPITREQIVAFLRQWEPYRELEAELARLEGERDEWLAPFDGSGIEWHESLPNPYTYQASDFTKLVAAVHEYEARAEAAEAQLATTRQALLPFVENWDFHACDYLVGEFEEEMRAIPAKVVDDIIEAQKITRRALATEEPA